MHMIDPGLVDAAALVAFFILSAWGLLAIAAVLTDRRPARAMCDEWDEEWYY